jgi:hypothetical protein
MPLYGIVGPREHGRHYARERGWLPWTSRASGGDGDIFARLISQPRDARGWTLDAVGPVPGLLSRIVSDPPWWRRLIVEAGMSVRGGVGGEFFPVFCPRCEWRTKRGWSLTQECAHCGERSCHACRQPVDKSTGCCVHGELCSIVKDPTNSDHDAWLRLTWAKTPGSVTHPPEVPLTRVDADSVEQWIVRGSLIGDPRISMRLYVARLRDTRSVCAIAGSIDEAPFATGAIDVAGGLKQIHDFLVQTHPEWLDEGAYELIARAKEDW